MAALLEKFGLVSWDLAASSSNTKAPQWIDEERDSFKVEWHKLTGLCYLNPGFDDMAPWVEKCAVESGLGAEILTLSQASVCTNWFADFVFGKAAVYFLRPRLKFIGHKDPFPKDLILSHYGPLVVPGFHLWRWK